MPRAIAPISSHPALLEFLDWPAWAGDNSAARGASGSEVNAQNSSAALSAEQRSIVAGLATAQSSIEPKYFYDHLGSSLFGSICHLPEYYPTRTEALVFQTYRQEIAALMGTGGYFFDLGAADCVKAEGWFDTLHPDHYVAIDISSSFLLESLKRVKARFPHMAMSGLGMDFSSHLQLPSHLRCDKPKFFYPGSSIGNFGPAEALAFLTRIREACGDHGQLLIGADQVKPVEILVPAYDDALGVTAAFNLNALNQINRVLGADFVLSDWRHKAFFNSAESRIEMHLEALRDLSVCYGADKTLVKNFTTGQTIHTENSYKYTPEGFSDLLRNAGFSNVDFWSDAQGWFGVYLARA